MSLPGALAAVLALSALAIAPAANASPEAPARRILADDAGPSGGRAASGRDSEPHAAADPRDTTQLEPGAAWAWPLRPPPEVVRGFAPPEQRWLPGHRGVDLLASGPGHEVVAPAPGRVRFVGHVAGKPVVVVEHEAALRSTFEPVTSTLAPGARVARGQGVGELASAPGHCAPQTCLHWGVLRGDAYLDPLALLSPRRVRLLPLP